MKTPARQRRLARGFLAVAVLVGLTTLIALLLAPSNEGPRTFRIAVAPGLTLELETSFGDLELFTSRSHDLPGGHGVYFLNIETGVVEGWRDNHGPDIGAYAISDDNRLVAMIRNEGRFLADRETGQVFRLLRTSDNSQFVFAEAWNLSGEIGTGRLASRADRVLFRFSGDWFAVIDLEPEPHLVASFQIADGQYALLSSDGRQAVVAGPNLYVVDLDNSKTEDAGSLASGEVVLLQNTLSGEGFFVAAAQKSGQKAQGEPVQWQHHYWDGTLLASGLAATNLSLSPRGDFLAWLEYSRQSWLPQPGSAAPPQPQKPWFPIVHVVDTRTGEPAFRVTGAICCGSPRNWWLSDSSGLVIGESVAFATGQVQPRKFFGLPSPTSTSVFAASAPLDAEGNVSSSGDSLAVVALDIHGNVLAYVTPPEGIRSFTRLWGGEGQEIRFLTPHFGGGFPGALSGVMDESLVRPSLELPPYNDGAVLSLNLGAEGAELLDQPAGNVVTSILREASVVVSDVKLTPDEVVTWRHLVWAKVITSTDDTGWLLLGTVVTSSPE